MQHNYTIFYTDDDTDDQDIFREALQILDNESKLYIQDDGRQLMQELLEGEVKPDVIFLDLNMPGQNGFETLKQIKNNELLETIPVVILTTSNDMDNATRAKFLGAAMYVTKPNDFNNYRHTMSLLLAIDWRRIPPKTETFFLNVHR